MSIKTSVVPVLFFAALCAPGFGYTVLWDTSHGVAGATNGVGGYQPSGEHSDLRDLLEYPDNDFTVNTTSLGFTDTNLADTDVAVVCVTSAFNSSYSPAEADSLADFVNDGGGLLIMGAHPFLPQGNDNSNIQPVADKFDIILAESGDTYTYSGNPALETLEHPVFAGFTETDDVFMQLAGEITIGENAFALAQDPTNEKILIAGANYGTGRVIALGDFNTFAISTVANGLNQDENRDFAVNTFEWLAVPEPATILLMATGFALLRRRR